MDYSHILYQRKEQYLRFFDHLNNLQKNIRKLKSHEFIYPAMQSNLEESLISLRKFRNDLKNNSDNWDRNLLIVPSYQYIYRTR